MYGEEAEGAVEVHSRVGDVVAFIERDTTPNAARLIALTVNEFRRLDLRLRY